MAARGAGCLERVLGADGFDILVGCDFRRTVTGFLVVMLLVARRVIPMAPPEIGRMVAAQVGALVRHLCTDDAAAITGACLSIDGGWTAR